MTARITIIGIAPMIFHVLPHLGVGQILVSAGTSLGAMIVAVERSGDPDIDVEITMIPLLVGGRSAF